jgi:hypothetical protein
MGNQLPCHICEEAPAEFACNCAGIITQLCANCLVTHLRDKSILHTSIDLDSLDKISRYDSYHHFSQNILEIGHALNLYRNDLLIFIHNIHAVNTKATKLLGEESSRVIAFCNKILRNVDDNIKKIADFLNHPRDQADVFIEGFKRNGLRGVLDYYPEVLNVCDKPLYDALQNLFRVGDTSPDGKDLDQILKEKEELNCKLLEMQELVEKFKEEIREQDLVILRQRKELIRQKKLTEDLDTEKNSVFTQTSQLRSELAQLSQDLQYKQSIIEDKDKLLEEKQELISDLHAQLASARESLQSKSRYALTDLDSLSKSVDSKTETSTSCSSYDLERLYNGKMNEEGWTTKEMFEKGNLSDSLFNVFSCLTNSYRMKQCPRCKREHKILMWKIRYLVCDCLTVVYCDFCGNKSGCECGRFDEMTKTILLANMPYQINHN